MSVPKPSPSVARFEEAAFGLFLHYGLYSLPARGEWAYHLLHLDTDRYRALADQFTAADFDARRIARFAKSCGMKYITLTARHHDGFSLYDTQGLNPFDAPHSAAHRDLVREFVDGCRAEGILPILYHTTLDWSLDCFDHDWEAYMDYLCASVRLLCENYGPLGGLWFDGNWSHPERDWHLDRMYGMIRELQPDALIINNTGLDARGQVAHPLIDSVTFERGTPTPLNREGMDHYITGEMCQTLNDHWGIAAQDFNYKSVPTLIEDLCACRKVGANYLLNIGPDGNGAIPPLPAALVTELGNWVRREGQHLYGGRPFAARSVPVAPGRPVEARDFLLKDGDTLCLFVHDPLRNDLLPDPATAGTDAAFDTARCLEVPDWDTVARGRAIASVRWMDNGEELAFRYADHHLWVRCTPYAYGESPVVRTAEIRFV